MFKPDPALILWLTADDNPAVKYRTQTELLCEKADKDAAISWLHNTFPSEWRAAKGLWCTYYLTAMAECGLTIGDLTFDRDAALLMHGGSGTVENNCGDFMHLRALVRLGLGNEPTVQNALKGIAEGALPDGGFLCLHRIKKLKYTPKSCIKANLHALLLCAECRKQGIPIPFTDGLLSYFWNHNIFYRTDDPSALILNAREGWRSIDTFYPFEVMRVGIQNTVEALCALGYGNDVRLREAWRILDARIVEDGKYVLNGSLTKSYLPKERAGKPSKWVTFYALLAKKEALHAGN